MRDFDLSPLFRSAIGFDRLPSLLDTAMRTAGTAESYPPYNIEKTGEDAYRITIAVAGFGRDDLDIEVRDVKHLTNVIAALRANPSINSVERARG